MTMVRPVTVTVPLAVSTATVCGSTNDAAPVSTSTLGMVSSIAKFSPRIPVVRSAVARTAAV
jgi:hypothetical protein